MIFGNDTRTYEQDKADALHHESFRWELSLRKTQDKLIGPIARHAMAPREAVAILELAGVLKDRGCNIGQILAAMEGA